MKKMRFIYIIAAAFLISGCGGSGGNSVSSGHGVKGEVSTASGQVAVVVFVQQWSEILWGVLTTQTGTQTPSQTDPVYNPDDGSYRSELTTADGTTATITTFADGSSRVNIIRPNGVTLTINQSAPVLNGNISTFILHVASSDGLIVDYTAAVDDKGTLFNADDDTTRLSGSSTLPGGIKQTFEVMTVPGQTKVTSVQSDGSTFTMNVPLTHSFPQLPDYSRETTGTYVSKNFNISYILTHPQTENNPARWSVFTSDLGNQLNGKFLLNKDFSGHGQFEEIGSAGQKVSAVLTWKQNGESQIGLLNGQFRQTQPAGAALDYLEHRWQTMTALMAPAPGM